jgi:hypothetical protein
MTPQSISFFSQSGGATNISSPLPVYQESPLSKTPMLKSTRTASLYRNTKELAKILYVKKPEPQNYLWLKILF